MTAAVLVWQEGDDPALAPDVRLPEPLTRCDHPSPEQADGCWGCDLPTGHDGYHAAFSSGANRDLLAVWTGEAG